MTAKLPPQNLEAEIRVLAGCIIGGEKHAIARIVTIVKPDHFSQFDNQVIYSAMRDIYRDGHAVDVVTIRDSLKASGKLKDVGGVEYLSQIMASDYSASNLEFYAKAVRDCATQRKIISAAEKILKDCYDPTAETPDLIEQAEKTFLDATKDSAISETADIAEVAERVGKDIRERKEGHLRGMSSGYIRIDQKTHGFQGGQLIVIGARASVGKTALALNIAEYLAFENQTATGFISLEMTPYALAERIITGRANVDSGKAQTGLLSPGELEKIKQTQEELSKAPLYIEPPFGMTPLVVRSKARRLVALHGIQCLFIDYLQLLRIPGKPRERYLEIGELTSSLKALALELNIPIIVLSQLNRASENRDRPRLSDLRESGNIEQDADVVLLIHREGYQNKSKPDDTAEIIVAKNRNGATGMIKLNWSGPWMRFDN